MNTRTPRVLVALVAGFALVAAACGSDDDATTSADAPPTTEDAAPAATDPPADGAPERIVSIAPTHTETLFAIGAGDQVVAVDQFSYYPPETADLPNELSSFEPNVEAIAAFEPALVVLSDGGFSGITEQLDAIGIEWWDGPPASSLDEAYAQMKELGDVTGNASAADALVAEMQAEIEQIVADTEVPDDALTYFHEISPDLFTATSESFIGEVYSLLGLQNIADAAGADTNFPQLNAEFVIEADPDLIFLADTMIGESAETVASRDGWAEMSAVVDGNVIEMDDDIASRWGPRIVDYLVAVSAAVEQALVPA